jgi:hypothetical protein
MVNWSLPMLMGILIVALSVAWSAQAQAGVILSSPDLPPESNPPDCDDLLSVYHGAGVNITYPGPVTLSNPVHKCFTNVFRQDIGEDEQQDFDSILEGLIDLGSGPVPITLTGPVTTRAYGKAGNTSGLYDTEMLSMSLTGMVGATKVEIQESPTLQSLGQVDIADLGGGLWQIDSFFDVFTELSIDDGPWMPQTSAAARIVLVDAGATPVEPTAWGAIKALFR